MKELGTPIQQIEISVPIQSVSSVFSLYMEYRLFCKLSHTGFSVSFGFDYEQDLL